MRKTIKTPQGCKYRQIASFLHPSGAPLIYIYQAGAQRTLGAVAPTLLLHCFQGSRTKPVPLHGLHRLHMSRIAPVVRHGAHPLRDLHPVNDMYHSRAERSNAGMWPHGLGEQRLATKAAIYTPQCESSIKDTPAGRADCQACLCRPQCAGTSNPSTLKPQQCSACGRPRVCRA